MRITVVVPDEGDERSAREYGIARARDAARKFGLDNKSWKPLPP